MEYENDDEKLIMEGLEASRTPCHVACLLGYTSIVEHLIEVGKADPNIVGEKGFNCGHFSVIGKQPEITQYLLTNSSIDYTTRDANGRDLEDMVALYMPMYLSHYKALVQSVASAQSNEAAMANYNHPDDERAIQGVQTNEDLNKIYREAKLEHDENKEEKSDKLYEAEEDDIKVEKGKEPDPIIERVFGMKTALGIISVSWKYREEALKYILKNAPQKMERDMEFIDTIKGC